MGQNLAIIWSTIPLADDDGDFPSRIQNWFNEVQKYAWGAKWSPATGHYSQVSIANLIREQTNRIKLWVLIETNKNSWRCKPEHIKIPHFLGSEALSSHYIRVHVTRK